MSLGCQLKNDAQTEIRELHFIQQIKLRTEAWDTASQIISEEVTGGGAGYIVIFAAKTR